MIIDAASIAYQEIIDMTTLKTNSISSGDLSTPSISHHTAHNMNGQQRQQLAIEGLTRTEPITKIAKRNNVGR